MNLSLCRSNHIQQRHKQTLRSILSKNCLSLVKVELLKSFKKQLQIEHQSRLKEHEQSKIKASRQVKGCDSTIYSSVLIDSQSRTSELSAVNLIAKYEKSAIFSASEYLEMRGQFSIILNELQIDMKKTYSLYENAMKKKTVKKIQGTNIKIAEVLEEFKKIKSSLSIVYEIITDNSKVLRVKNDLLKKSLPISKTNENKYLKKNNKETKILQENDQNNNQILVNL